MSSANRFLLNWESLQVGVSLVLNSSIVTIEVDMPTQANCEYFLDCPDSTTQDSLEILDLSHNKLKGMIPSQFASFVDRNTSVDLRGNTDM